MKYRVMILLGILTGLTNQTRTRAAPNLFVAIDSENEVKHFRMEAGQQKTMILEGAKRISVNNPRCADIVKIAGDEFLLHAVGAGKCNILIFRANKPNLLLKLHVTDNLYRKSFVLNHADGQELESSMKTYLSPVGRISFSPATGTLNVVDEEAVVLAIGKMISQFDVPKPRLQLVLRLVATSLGSGMEDLPDNLKPVHHALQQIMKIMQYKRFILLDEALVTVKASQTSSLRLGTRPKFNARIRTTYHHEQPSLEFRLTDSKSNEVVMETTTDIQDGETVVLGTSKIDGDEQALIILVTVNIQK